MPFLARKRKYVFSLNFLHYGSLLPVRHGITVSVQETVVPIVSLKEYSVQAASEEMHETGTP